MTVLSFAAVVAAGLYLWAGLFVLDKQRHSPVSRLFAVTCLVLGWWALCFGFHVSAPTRQGAWLWYRLSAPGWTLVPALFLHFFLHMSESLPATRRRVRVSVLYVPAAVFLVLAVRGATPASGVARTALGWTEVGAHSLSTYAFTAYYASYLVIGCAALWLWGGRSTIGNRRRQTRCILLWCLLSTGAAGLTNSVLPLAGVHVVPATAPIALAAWVMATLYAMVRYSLIAMTPAAAAEEILSTMSDGVLLSGPDNRIMQVNAAATRVLELPEEQLLGRTVRDLFPDDGLTTTQVFHHFQTTASDLRRETDFVTPSGKLMTLLISSSTVRDDTGQAVGVVMIIRDISIEKEAEEQLAHLAHHDALTALPNRSLLIDRLSQDIARTLRYGHLTAVMMLDLDHFKDINDTMGHDAGDELLKGVAKRLSGCVRSCDTVARLGGDEFVLLIGELPDGATAKVVADRVLNALDRPLVIGGEEVTITPSIGIAVCPDDSSEPAELLRLADLAMYESKSGGRDTYTYFHKRMLSEVQLKNTMETLLRKAIDQDRFVLHYQPLFDLQSRQPTCMEALLRWEHPELGMVPPLEFLHVAESAGLMPEIGEWVINTACRQCTYWHQTLGVDIPVAVNLTGKQAADTSLPRLVEKILHRVDLDSRFLHLEVTEGSMLDGPDTRNTLERLAKLGVTLALDNFGTGSISLVKLSELPFSTLKLDRSLIRRLGHDDSVEVVIAASVAVAHQYQLKVVAEGVEDEEQLSHLNRLHSVDFGNLICDQVQGFLLGRPASAEQMTQYLRMGDARSVG